MLQKDGEFKARKEGFGMANNVPIRILYLNFRFSGAVYKYVLLLRFSSHQRTGKVCSILNI